MSLHVTYNEQAPTWRHAVCCFKGLGGVRINSYISIHMFAFNLYCWFALGMAVVDTAAWKSFKQRQKSRLIVLSIQKPHTNAKLVWWKWQAIYKQQTYKVKLKFAVNWNISHIYAYIQVTYHIYGSTRLTHTHSQTSRPYHIVKYH